MSNIKKVKGQVRFVIVLNEYSNGIETTGGLYKPDELEDTQGYFIFGITYDSDHATELPVDWPNIEVLDDNNMRQKIKAIHWNRPDKRYEMEDGTFSETVTV